MTLNTWQNCGLDDASVRSLQAWEAELNVSENAVITLEGQLDTALADLTATSKTAATITLTTGGGVADAVLLTWIDNVASYQGTDAHQAGVLLRTTGSNVALSSVAYWDLNTLIVTLATDALGAVTTTSTQLVAHLVAYANLFTATDLLPGFVLDATDTVVNFSGAENAALTSTETALNNVYKTTGKTWDEVLDTLAVPYALSSTSARQVLASVSDLVTLVSGNTFEQQGSNLTVLRDLWTLLGASATATTTLAAQLPGTAGQPLVVWQRSVGTSTTGTPCQGGTVTAVTTISVVGAVNARPASTSGLTPTVWWRQSIDPSLTSLTILNRAGLSDTQVNDALDADNANTHVIEDPTLWATFSLTNADFTELMNLTEVAGIVSADYEVGLAELLNQPVGAVGGWLSASWNWPPDTLSANLSPAKTMASDIAAINSSDCIDPLKKSGLITFVSMVNSMVDVATRLVTRISGKVRPVVNKISGLLANVQKVLDNLNGASCIFGVDIEAQLPQIDILVAQIKFATIDFKSFFDIIDAMVQVLLKMTCKIEQALRDLLGPIAGLAPAECLIQGLTDLAINAFGRLQNKLGELGLPCVTDPFSYTSILLDLQIKVGALASLANSMLKDLRNIQTQWNLISDIDVQTNDEPVTASSCSSAALQTLVKRLKSQFTL